jgi:RNA polymerase sigma-70 factor, ECF subfamily
MIVMINPTQDELLEKLIAGDKTAFEALFRKKYLRLRNYAYQITNDINFSEDIVQDLFFKLWSKKELLQKVTCLDSYLRTSVHHGSINYLKEFNQKKGIDIESDQYILFESLHLEILTYQRDIASEKELSTAIAKAIESLPEQCRMVFKLSRNLGLKYNDIAKELNISVKTVEKHISHALQFLRTSMKYYITLVFLLLIFL